MSTLGMFSTLGGYHEYSGGDTMSTLGDVQYTGRISWVHRGLTMMSVGDIMSTLGMFSTLGDTMSTLGVYHDEWVWGYIMSTLGVFSTWGDIMSTLGGVQYTVGLSWVHWGIPRCMWGLSRVHRGVFSTLEGYHEYTGGISWGHWGVFSTPGAWFYNMTDKSIPSSFAISAFSESSYGNRQRKLAHAQ